MTFLKTGNKILWEETLEKWQCPAERDAPVAIAGGGLAIDKEVRDVVLDERCELWLDAASKETSTFRSPCAMARPPRPAIKLSSSLHASS